MRKMLHSVCCYKDGKTRPGTTLAKTKAPENTTGPTKKSTALSRH